MVFNAIVTLLLGLIQLILTPIPNIPALPSAISNGASWVTTTIGSVIGVIDWVLGAPLVTAAVGVILGILAFEWAYHPVMWVLKKIPFLNIK